jgi:HSP20 family protein
MSITLWKKNHEPAFGNGNLSRLRDEMDRTIDRFFVEPWGGFGLIEPKSMRAETWIPALDIHENDNEVTLHAEIPGIAAKDLEINISGTTLTIAGHKQERQEHKGGNCWNCECRYGSFRRVVELPETVDPDRVTAESDNGVVTIRVAKKPGAKTKKVEVKPSQKKVPVSG